MMTTTAALLTGLTLALGAAPTPPELTVRAELESPPVIEPGERIQIKARLVNSSRTATLPIVLPGDGSESAWREPYVYYSAEAATGDEMWRPVGEGLRGRCGLYDDDWTDEIRTLAPGESVDLGWMSSPHWALDLPTSGRVRIRVHYAWRHPSVTRSQRTAEGTPMEGIAPYEIVSDPIEIDIRGLLVVELKPAGRALRAGRARNLDRVFAAEVRGAVMAPVALGIIEIQFEVRGESASAGWRPHAQRVRGRDLPAELGRGGSLALVGGRRPAFDGAWEYPKAETVQLRAILQRNVGAVHTTYKSNWIEVVVAP